jgi:hypothetical protein
MIKSGRLRWMQVIAPMGAMRKAYGFCVENWNGRDHAGYIDGRIILKWIFKEWDSECGIVLFGLE